MRVNVALLPSPDISKNLVESAHSISAEDCSFTIGRTLRPHMTLYMFDVQNAEDVAARLESLMGTLRESGEISCRATGFALTANGYSEVSYEKTSHLVSVQAQIISGLSSLCYHTGEPDSHLSMVEANNLANFGYEFIGDQFRPHITLGRFNPEKSVTLPVLRRSSLSFTAGMIGLLAADAAGAATKLILERSLAR